ncbi:MAG TPA: methyltransferase domain-containing protein [Bryobacteraceae bacterium]|jgi:Methylase involved in ubiquinone/menaquinone biosynthesis|nr:methyltransferase domain-containing protein [Bryobacteraceae bacterium]
MPELDRRLADLTPEKRRILTELLKSKASTAREERGGVTVTVDTALAASAPEPQPLEDLSNPGAPYATKVSWKRFYDGVSAQLNSNVFGQFSYFLNYGYKPDGQPEYAAAPLPEQYINKNSVKLVLEVIGDCPVEGKRVLDVGCGRGGTVHVFQTFFKPASIRGLDLSSTAIQFCRQAHKRKDTTFYEGDAENLPFEDSSLDIVTNLESSHSYPNIFRFYSEVHRVLASGGHFLYTDTLALQQMASCIRYLQQLGFEVLRDRDITRNVLLSCDEIAATRMGAFDTRNDQQLIHNFLATPGSQVYEEMRSGRWTYRILKLKKQS